MTIYPQTLFEFSKKFDETISEFKPPKKFPPYAGYNSTRAK
jgi:hypothetical protein